MSNKTWEKIEQNPTWNYKNEDTDEFSLKKGDELEGIYLSFEENVGSNNSTIFNFRKEDGSKISVWGSTVLLTRFKNLVVGEEVKIVYKGSVESQQVKGRSYHDYDVFHRPMEKVEPKNDDKPTKEDLEQIGF